MSTHDPELARTFALRLADADDEVAAAGLDEGGPGSSMAFGVLVGWLVSARDRGSSDLAAPVLEWVSHHLGPSGSSLRSVAGFLGESGAREMTVNAVIDELGDDLIPALVWLVSGAVAVVGNGDLTWLDSLDDGVE